MQEICSSNPPVVTGIFYPNKFWAQHCHSYKLNYIICFLKNHLLHNCFLFKLSQYINKLKQLPQIWYILYISGLNFKLSQVKEDLCKINYTELLLPTPLCKIINPSHPDPGRQEKFNLKFLFSNFLVVPQKVLWRSLRPS